MGETTPESPKNEVAEEAKPEVENKDETSPETPVTEPITNGSGTPESSKVETPVIDEPVVAVPETNRPETTTETEPEKLPVNGLSLEEPKNDAIEKPQSAESKSEEPTALTTELAPAPEIPVKIEVCVEQMPLVEPIPPPLPTNPPPSSVASFAATTMAPELTDASLSNTTETAIISPSSILDTKSDLPNEVTLSPKEEAPQIVTNTDTGSVTDLLPSQTEVSDGNLVEKKNPEREIHDNELSNNEKSSEIIQNVEVSDIQQNLEEMRTEAEACLSPPAPIESNIVAESSDDPSELIEDLPPPPPVDDDVSRSEIVENLDNVIKVNQVSEETVDSNLTTVVSFSNDLNGVDKITFNGNNETKDDPDMENKNKDILGNVIEVIECNGNIDESNIVTKVDTVISDNTNTELEKAQTTPDDSLPPSLSEANESLPAAEAGEASESFPLPPSELCRSESEVSPSATPEPNGEAATDTPQVNTVRTVLLL